MVIISPEKGDAKHLTSPKVALESSNLSGKRSVPSIEETKLSEKATTLNQPPLLQAIDNSKGLSDIQSLTTSSQGDKYNTGNALGVRALPTPVGVREDVSSRTKESMSRHESIAKNKYRSKQVLQHAVHIQPNYLRGFSTESRSVGNISEVATLNHTTSIASLITMNKSSDMTQIPVSSATTSINRQDRSRNISVLDSIVLDTIPNVMMKNDDKPSKNSSWSDWMPKLISHNTKALVNSSSTDTKSKTSRTSLYANTKYIVELDDQDVKSLLINPTLYYPTVIVFYASW